MDKDTLLNADLAAAEKLFQSKVATGKYDHYTPEMLYLLFEDCVRQTVTMRKINNDERRSEESAV